MTWDDLDGDAANCASCFAALAIRCGLRLLPSPATQRSHRNPRPRASTKRLPRSGQPRTSTRAVAVASIAPPPRNGASGQEPENSRVGPYQAGQGDASLAKIVHVLRIGGQVLRQAANRASEIACQIEAGCLAARGIGVQCRLKTLSKYLRLRDSSRFGFHHQACV